MQTERDSELDALIQGSDLETCRQVLLALSHPDNGAIISGSIGPLFNVGWDSAWQSVRNSIRKKCQDATPAYHPFGEPGSPEYESLKAGYEAAGRVG